MPRSTSGNRSRTAAGLPAVTAEQIADAAVKLTCEHGVDGWTVRQLAGALDAWPAVVYHHVGDREAVVHEVIERVAAQLPLPEAELPWREWFRVLLGPMRPILRKHPGVARRMALHNPTVPSAVVGIDRGIQVLRKAGFGDEAVSVYRLLLSTAALLIAMEDEREADQARLRNAVERFSSFRNREDLPGMAAVGELAREVEVDPDLIEARNAEFYEYAIERCLDGVQARLYALLNE